MKRSAFAVMVAAMVGLVVAGGCMLFQPPQPPMQMSGTLRSVKPAGGGKPTGWVLSSGEMMGMQGQATPLDVSAVQSQAEALDGKQVMLKAVPKQSGSGSMLVVQEIGEISH